MKVGSKILSTYFQVAKDNHYPEFQTSTSTLQKHGTVTVISIISIAAQKTPEVEENCENDFSLVMLIKTQPLKRIID